MAPVEEQLPILDFDRSNKGASKQRRDMINAEISIMRDLLPLPESSRQRLSQLQIMSLTCVYIRKCNVLQKLFPTQSHEQLPESLDFFQALTGFLLVTTREGKLLYISENVTDFLGHSMVDMKTQGDSLYDIVDKRDHGSVQAQLLLGPPTAPQGGPDKESMKEVSFFCRMNMSRTLKRQSGFGDVKVMHVRGHFIHTDMTPETSCGTGTGDSQCVFMATCCPLITPDVKENLVQNNTMVFKTVHKLDMTFVEITNTAEYHLGCSSDELAGKSWYTMLHPEDIHEAKEKHVQLIRSNHEMGSMMTVRLLKGDGSSFWVNTVMHVRQASLSNDDEPHIVCLNQVIDAREAYQIKRQGHMFSSYPNRAQEMWSNHLPSVATPGSDHTMAPHWPQQAAGNTVLMPGCHGNIPIYIAQGGRAPAYQNCGAAVMQHSRVSKSQSPSGLTQYSPALVQSDQLKAMLKRKIQGPQQTSCKPSKMSKMTWDMDGSNESSGYPEMDQGMNFMEQYGSAQLPSYSDCRGPTMQVMQPVNYRFGTMTAKRTHKVLNCQGMPNIMTKSGMFSEQVVPEVNVPDSYLTPDPSPVSSPEPSFVSVKTEVMDPEDSAGQGKSSFNIIQALEKLAALPDQPKKEMPSVPQTMQAQAQMQPRDVQKKKELPIFNAFEIDNFFDALVEPEDESKASIKMEPVPTPMKQVQVKAESPEDNSSSAVTNIPNFDALKEEPSSPAQCLAYSSSPMQQQQQQPVPNVTNPSTQSPAPQSYMPISPEPRTVLSFTCQDEIALSPEQQTSCPNKKDQVVTSTMVSSPKSITSQKSIDELLGYFSDDGMVAISPLGMETGSSVLETTSTSDDLLDDQFETTYSKPFYMDSHCSLSRQMGSQRLPEELSPQSSAASLAGEDDVLDDTSTMTLDMALDALDAQGQMEDQCPQYSIKDREVLGDELKQLDFIFNPYMPAEGSLNMIKHGQ